MNYRLLFALVAVTLLAPLRYVCAQQHPDKATTFMRDTEATLRVEGTVTTVNTSPAGTVFINFGLPYPRQTFAAIIFHRDASRFPDPKQWEGKRVVVTGKLHMYEKRPAMVLKDADQLTLAPPPRSPN